MKQLGRGEALPELRKLIAWPCPECCIEWNHSVSSGNDRGMIYSSELKRPITAARMVLIITDGPDRPGMQAAHSCRNVRCVNPLHLSWKVPKDHYKDQFRDDTHTIGERNAQAKLTLEQAQWAYDQWRAGVRQCDIADELQVSRPLINGIIKGRRWPEVQR